MSRTIKLSRPIEDDGRTVENLSLREMTVGDLIAIDSVDGAARKNVTLISLMSGLPVKAVERLSLRDYKAVVEEIDNMGELEDEAGSTPSP